MLCWGGTRGAGTHFMVVTTCAHTCVHERVCTCRSVHACVRAYMQTHADNDAQLYSMCIIQHQLVHVYRPCISNVCHPGSIYLVSTSRKTT